MKAHFFFNQIICKLMHWMYQMPVCKFKVACYSHSCLPNCHHLCPYFSFFLLGVHVNGYLHIFKDSKLENTHTVTKIPEFTSVFMCCVPKKYLSQNAAWTFLRRFLHRIVTCVGPLVLLVSTFYPPNFHPWLSLKLVLSPFSLLSTFFGMFDQPHVVCRTLAKKVSSEICIQAIRVCAS